MKVLKKLTTFIAAFLVMFSMGAVSALAAETGTITITPPEGVDADATNTYKIYKVFDAVGNGTGISYKLVPGKTTAPAGFSVDAVGNVSYTGQGTNNQLTADDIAAIKNYVTDDDLVDTATSTGTADAISEALPNGYYFIATSTGTAVTITSTNPNATVSDKNTVPTVDKKITKADEWSEDYKKALAQIGNEVEYTATITVGKGSKNLVFHDKMQTGLTFAGNSSVTVEGTVEGTRVDVKYTILETPAQGDTITIKFDDDIAADTITIKYIAVVNADALTKLENDAYLTYGDNYESEHSKAEVYNATIKVLKNDGKNTEGKEDDTPLAGAGFKLKNSAGKYYKLTTATDGKLTVTWVDTEAEGDEHVSGQDGNVPGFVGLANGTYTLVETKVPLGFNKAADTTVTISGGDYSAETLKLLAHTEPVINNQGSLLPSTGGMGTTIFYILGGILIVAGVAYFMVRRKVNAE